MLAKDLNVIQGKDLFSYFVMKKLTSLEASSVRVLLSEQHSTFAKLCRVSFVHLRNMLTTFDFSVTEVKLPWTEELTGGMDI